MTTLHAADAAGIAGAVATLRRGGLVALPTETVYGLAADALDEQAVARIFAVKGRPADHPLIVHLPDAEHMTRWARSLPREALALARAFWPGPLTLIVPRADDVPDIVTGGQDSVGLRVPAHPVALAVLRAFDSGIAAPSANRFGRISPTTAAHVADEPAAPAGGAPITDGYVVALKSWANSLLGTITADRIAWRGERRCIDRLKDAGQVQ